MQSVHAPRSAWSRNCFKNLRHHGTQPDAGSCAAHECLVIDRSPHIRPLAICQLNPVWVTLIPEPDDLALGKPTRSPGLNGVPDLEAQGLLRFANFQPLEECISVEVLADEDEAALPLLARCPTVDVRKVPVEEHAHALEDKFRLHTFHSQHPLVSIQVGTFLLDQLTDPHVQPVHVQLTLPFASDARRPGVVLMLRSVGSAYELRLLG
mmetsp:Transcript_91298/g.181484  ORF Transcript_91298/g.181484 Transcript_91298/m.181484 type:complete len:209 (+) Transcript_91298:242-868(+)